MLQFCYSWKHVLGASVSAENKDFRAPPKKRKVRERRVPSTPLGRVMGYGSRFCVCCYIAITAREDLFECLRFFYM